MSRVLVTNVQGSEEEVPNNDGCREKLGVVHKQQYGVEFWERRGEKRKNKTQNAQKTYSYVCRPKACGQK